MMNLLLAMATFIRITSVHDVTMTVDNTYMHHYVYNYNYTITYVDETYKLDEETGEWIKE